MLDSFRSRCYRRRLYGLRCGSFRRRSWCSAFSRGLRSSCFRLHCFCLYLRYGFFRGNRQCGEIPDRTEDHGHGKCKRQYSFFTTHVISSVVFFSRYCVLKLTGCVSDRNFSSEMRLFFDLKVRFMVQKAFVTILQHICKSALLCQLFLTLCQMMNVIMSTEYHLPLRTGPEAGRSWKGSSQTLPVIRSARSRRIFPTRSASEKALPPHKDAVWPFRYP